MRWLGLVVLVVWAAAPGGADEHGLRLRLADEITDAGLGRHLVPRFALKTGQKVDLVTGAADDWDAAILPAPQPDGVPVMTREAVVFELVVRERTPATDRFSQWLLSDIGRRTIAAFRPEDGVAFAPPPEQVETVVFTFEGDAELGAKLARQHCARCHRIASDVNGGIGSTPSFMALRALPDWSERMSNYYVRNPHPSFMRVADVSPEFTEANPPAIAPVVLSQREVEAIQAYVSAIEPADLGAPIRYE